MSNTIFNPVRGMRDFTPTEMNVREKTLNIIQQTCLSNGFNQIKTPAIESKDFLSKGNEESDNSKIGYVVQSDRSTGKEPSLGLRYDLTVPLSRFFSNNKSELVLPFRSYQTGDVYRAERPQRGRYREFTQCDIDVLP